MMDNKATRNTAIKARDTKTVADIQMVFQNPFDTLNLSMTVGRQNDAERRDRMLNLLDLVKLPPALADRMPRQLTGDELANMEPVIKIAAE